MSTGQVTEIRRKFEQEYLPIRIGNWSKNAIPITQVIDENTKNSCNPDIGCLYIDDDQTRPKTSIAEDCIVETIQKLDEYFQNKSMPTMDQKDPVSEKPSQSPDSAIYINVIPPMDLEQDDWLCKKGITKVFVEFESHSLLCEGCGCEFGDIDDAAKHFPNSDSKEVVEEIIVKETIYVTTNQDIDYENQPTLKRSDNEETPNETEPSSERAETDRNCSSPSERIFKESDEDESTSRSVTDSELSKFLLFENGKQTTKRITKKKKKSKAWRFIRGSFMLVIRILF